MHFSVVRVIRKLAFCVSILSYMSSIFNSASAFNSKTSCRNHLYRFCFALFSASFLRATETTQSFYYLFFLFHMALKNFYSVLFLSFKEEFIIRKNSSLSVNISKQIGYLAK